MASRVAFDPEELSLGRIRADSIPPPRSLASIKRCISRVERTPELAHADLFADISCDAPLKEGHISILLTDGPGLSPNKPMAIVQKPIVQTSIVQKPIIQEESPPIPDGKYVIKNRAGNIYWSAWGSPVMTVHFWHITMGNANNYSCEQVNEHFLNYSSAQKINFFQSGTSHMMLMVTYPCDHFMICGLVLKRLELLGLRCLFRGD